MLISYIHLSSPSCCLLHPTPLDHHSAPYWVPCVTQQLPTSYLFYTWFYMYIYIYINATLSICPAFFLHYIHKSHLHLHLYSCSENRFINTICLDSIYIYICVCVFIFVFSFWLTSVWMTDSRFIHITANDPVSLLYMAIKYSMVYVYLNFFIH